MPVVLKVIGVIIIIGLVVSWFALLVGMFLGSPYLDFVVPGTTLFSYLGALSLFMIIGIPLFWIVLLILRVFFQTRLSKGWRTALAVFWGAAFVGFFFSATMVAREFEYGAEITMEEKILDVASDTLELSLVAKEYDALFGLDDGEVKITDDKLVFENMSISIKRAEGPSFEFVQVNEARGISPQQANDLAASIGFDYQLEGSHLKLPADIEVTKNEKFRVQGVKVTVFVPEGKFVKFGRDVAHAHGHVQRKDTEHHIWESRGNTWVMEDLGLVCVDCE